MEFKLNNGTVRELKELLNKVPEEHLDRPINIFSADDFGVINCPSELDIEMVVTEED